MSSRDVSHLSDISRQAADAQGAFKRPPSSFRNFIQAGGQFPPEKGTFWWWRLGPHFPPSIERG